MKIAKRWEAAAAAEVAAAEKAAVANAAAARVAELAGAATAPVPDVLAFQTLSASMPTPLEVLASTADSMARAVAVAMAAIDDEPRGVIGPKGLAGARAPITEAQAARAIQRGFMQMKAKRAAVAASASLVRASAL
jgi:hypothetical protein